MSIAPIVDLRRWWLTYLPESGNRHFSGNIETDWVDGYSMASLGGPADWVPGRSRLPWYCGMLVVLWISYFLANLALDFGFSWAGISLVSPRVMLLVYVLAVGFAAGPLFVWVLAVPIPASRLGLNSAGVMFDEGFRMRFVPWQRAHQKDGRLEIHSRWFGLRTVYSLTPLQEKCIELIQPPSNP